MGVIYIYIVNATVAFKFWIDTITCKSITGFQAEYTHTGGLHNHRVKIPTIVLPYTYRI